MARDRFVKFKDKLPTSGEVERVIRNYIGDAGTVEWDQNRWSVLLPGKVSNPFDGISPLPELPKEQRTERWIEVYFQPDQPLDVITRLQDEFTNAIADQLARVIARYYQADLEME